MAISYDIGEESEFAEETISRLRLGGRDIAVIRWGGRLFAVRNTCPHQAAELCGVVSHRVTSGGAGRVGAEVRKPLVQCTWHRWEFDLESGRALCDPKLRVKTYPIQVKEGRVIVDA